MNYLLLSVFMLLVTFVPRVLPGFLLDKITLGAKAKKFLTKQVSAAKILPPKPMSR